MRGISLFIAVCVLAAVLPLVPQQSRSVKEAGGPEAWPESFEGTALVRVPLTEREARFAADFPGGIARFIAGSRVILIRRVDRETRKLHPAADCFKGSGYTIRPGVLKRDASGRLWGSFQASRKDERIEVRERIQDAADHQWTDVSSWYWAALLGRTKGPWQAVTVVESLSGEPAN